MNKRFGNSGLAVLIGLVATACDSATLVHPNSQPPLFSATHNPGFLAGTVEPAGSWRYHWNDDLARWGLRITQPAR